MPPRKKLPENRPHPQRWRWKNGAWRYQVPKEARHLWDNKTEFTLGKTEAEAYRVWSKRINTIANGMLYTMEQAIDKYRIEVVPLKAPSTQKSNNYSLKRLKQAFAGNAIAAIQPHHIYKYKSAIAATLSEKHYNLDHEVLSHLFTKCIEWGARNDHPMTGKKVTKFPANERTRYVEDWELAEFLKVANPFLQVYINLKGFLGQDKADMLSIRLSNISEDGITLEPRRKTARKRKNARRRFFPYYIEIGEERISTGLKEAVDAILALKRPAKTEYLFCTRSGQPYIKPDGDTSGFNSMWQRTMAKALEETKLKERFTEHDLRAKVASDLETDEQAQRQLDHTNVRTTRIYRRKAINMPVAKGFQEDE